MLVNRPIDVKLNLSLCQEVDRLERENHLGLLFAHIRAWVSLPDDYVNQKNFFPAKFLDSFHLSDQTTSPPLIFLAFCVPPRNMIYH